MASAAVLKQLAQRHPRLWLPSEQAPLAAPAPARWSFAALAGRLVELSAREGSAALTLAVRLVAEAQEAGDLAAWVMGENSTFYPPDALSHGIDLEQLAVVRVADSAPFETGSASGGTLLRDADRISKQSSVVRHTQVFRCDDRGHATSLKNPVPCQCCHAEQSEASLRIHASEALPRTEERSFASLRMTRPVESEYGDQLSGGAADSSRKTDSAPDPIGFQGPSALGGVRGSAPHHGGNLAVPLAAARLVHSGGFGLVVLDLTATQRLPDALLGRLVREAQRHEALVLCLTRKAASAPSLGSLISLRVEASRKKLGTDRFQCIVKALKDKRHGAGWTHEEVLHGAPGLH